MGVVGKGRSEMQKEGKREHFEGRRKRGKEENYRARYCFDIQLNDFDVPSGSQKRDFVRGQLIDQWISLVSNTPQYTQSTIQHNPDNILTISNNPKTERENWANLYQITKRKSKKNPCGIPFCRRMQMGTSPARLLINCSFASTLTVIFYILR